jgi:Flp pilus assembly protein TadG
LHVPADGIGTWSEVFAPGGSRVKVFAAELVLVYEGAARFCCVCIGAMPVHDDVAGGAANRASAPAVRDLLLARLGRSERGGTMVEFAIVALPFFLLLMGAFDIGFYYWGSEELENATAHGARLVRTGQVQTGGIDQAQLKSDICSKTAVLVGCASRLRIDVRSGRSLADITPPSPLNGAGQMKSDADFVFLPGAGNDVVLVSAFFNWQLLLKPSDYILRAATVTRNEPF